MTAEGTVFATSQDLRVVLVMAIVMHWLWLCVLFFVGTGLALGPLPAMLYQEHAARLLHRALGTMSSAATISGGPASQQEQRRERRASPTSPCPCAPPFTSVSSHHHPGDLCHGG